MKITVYRAQDGWRWRARAVNGEIVSESGEAYENKSYALEAARRFGPADAEIEVEDRQGRQLRVKRRRFAAGAVNEGLPTRGIGTADIPVSSQHHRSYAARGPRCSYKPLWSCCPRLLKHVWHQRCNVFTVHDHGGNESLPGVAEHLVLPRPIR